METTSLNIRHKSLKVKTAYSVALRTGTVETASLYIRHKLLKVKTDYSVALRTDTMFGLPRTELSNHSDKLFHEEDLEDDGAADMASESEEEIENRFCICCTMKEKIK